jgi:hypothetical protein
MAKKIAQPLSKIVRFSESMKLDSKAFIAAGVLDPILGVDVNVFIDPQRLFHTKLPEFSSARARIEKYFTDTFRLLKLSSSPSDSFHRQAVRRLTFKETKGVGIGFGRDTDDGNGIGEGLAKRLVSTAKMILKKTVEDPAVFELLGLFEDDFGPDRLSDLTIFILRKDFLRFTARAAVKIGIPNLGHYTFDGETFRVPFRKGTNIPITLLPLDLIRDLPIATSFDEIEDAGYLNKELRACWRDIIHKAHEVGTEPGKDDAKRLFLEHPEFFEPLLESYKKNNSGPYDFIKDPRGLLSWASFAMEYASNHPLALKKDIRTLHDLRQVVGSIVDQFRRNIESNGLNKLLYKPDGRPQREAFAQLLFFASADAYCRANGLDLSPESNAGRGPVDFKISRGCLKIVVEIKLSTHKGLVKGFEDQLEIYKEAESALDGFYVIVRVSETIPSAVKEIEKSISNRRKRGEKTSVLRIIDGTIHPSASRSQR